MFQSQCQENMKYRLTNYFLLLLICMMGCNYLLKPCKLQVIMVLWWSLKTFRSSIFILWNCFNVLQTHTWRLSFKRYIIRIMNDLQFPVVEILFTYTAVRITITESLCTSGKTFAKETVKPWLRNIFSRIRSHIYGGFSGPIMIFKV